ncbi:MAG: hypothetical protein LBR26_09895 [Prevotella sp.]|jgi:hypothetical protein|nr:hypothetical protein [Prevotella sp.]
MTIREFIYKVKVKLQELTPYGSGLGVLDPDTSRITPLTEGLVVLDPKRLDKPGETYIKECIEEAFMYLRNISPADLLTAVEMDRMSTVAIPNQDGSGHIFLPDDFYSLKIFKMIGWERPVTGSISMDNPKYTEQFNPYLRGGVSTPVCAVVKTDKGMKLEYYSLPKNFKRHEIEYGYYFPKLKIDIHDPDASIFDNMDERLLYVLVYLTAARVQFIYEQSDLYEKSKQLALEDLQIIKAAMNNERT